MSRKDDEGIDATPPATPSDIEERLLYQGTVEITPEKARELLEDASAPLPHGLTRRTLNTIAFGVPYGSPGPDAVARSVPAIPYVDPLRKFQYPPETGRVSSDRPNTTNISKSQNALGMTPVDPDAADRVEEAITRVGGPFPPPPAAQPTPELTDRVGSAKHNSMPPGVYVTDLGQGYLGIADQQRQLTPADVEAALRMYFAFKDVEPETLHQRLDVLTSKLGGLTLAEFQDGCNQTAVYPGVGNCFGYPLLGMIDEVGEAIQVLQSVTQPDDSGMPIAQQVFILAQLVGQVAGHCKKAYRNDPRRRLGDYSLTMIRGAVDATHEHLRRLVSLLDDSLVIDLPPIVLTPEEHKAFAREWGDAGYYWNQSLTELRLSAEGVARDLREKLRNRKAMGTLRSTGDDEATRPPGLDAEDKLPAAEN
jgi:hypothetical protein